MKPRLVEVWLGAFGQPKPYDAQPGDTWVLAYLVAKKPGSIYAKQKVGPFTNWVADKHWRERSDG